MSQNGSGTTESDGCVCSRNSLTPDVGSATASFDIRSFELVRRFVEHVVANNASVAPETSPYAIDWSTLKVSIEGSRTLEQAIGRGAAVADQMSRGYFDGRQRQDLSSAFIADDQFFAFSMVDVTPDFGEESRYRTKVARRVAKMLRPGERQ